MKKIFLLSCFFLLLSCKNQETEYEKISAKNQSPSELGKELFEGKGNCVACHQVDQKIIGPSLQDIAKIYKAENGNIVDFLKNDASPLVDSSQYEIMKTNFIITKSMTDEEFKSIEAYIYSK